MANDTKIEWTNVTINPIRARRKGSTSTKGGYSSGVGHYCEKVSPGCKNCYASTLQPRFGLPLFQEQRNGETEVFFDASKLEEVLRLKKPAKVFWCDMTDMFGAWVPNEWIAACFGVMAATPHLTHHVLTKRAERLPGWFAWAEKRGHDGARLFADDPLDWRIRQLLHVEARRAGVDMNADTRQNHGGPWPLPNVWIGVSVEDQARADERIPHLLRVPAAVRFLSCEPLLGEVDLRRVRHMDACRACGGEGTCGVCGPTGRVARQSLDSIDWVIVGGESGPGARPMRLEWAQSLVDQCKAAGVACFVKQLGARPEIADQFGVMPLRSISRIDRKGGDPMDWPESLRVRQFPEGGFR